MDLNHNTRRTPYRTRMPRKSPSPNLSPLRKKPVLKLTIPQKLGTESFTPVSCVPLQNKTFTFECTHKINKNKTRPNLVIFAAVLQLLEPPFNRLPNEILHKICENLEKPDLQNLRWLRSRISSVALEHMSPVELTVNIQKHSLLRFIDISGHSSMRRNVTSIIFPTSITSSKAIRDTPDILEHQADLAFQAVEQDELLHDRGLVSRLADALSRFPKLESIQFSGGQCQTKGLITFFDHLIVSVLQIVLQSPHIKLRKLALSRIPYGVIPMMVSEPLQLRSRMSLVRTLELRWQVVRCVDFSHTISGEPKASHSRWVWPPPVDIAGLSDLLQFFPELRHLKICFIGTAFTKRGERPAESNILKTLTLPHLQSLWLRNACLVINEVSGFVRRHKLHLKELLLLSCQIKNEGRLSGLKFRRDVGEAGQLRIFHTHGLEVQSDVR